MEEAYIIINQETLFCTVDGKAMPIRPSDWLTLKADRKVIGGTTPLSSCSLVCPSCLEPVSVVEKDRKGKKGSLGFAHSTLEAELLCPSLNVVQKIWGPVVGQNNYNVLERSFNKKELSWQWEGCSCLTSILERNVPSLWKNQSLESQRTQAVVVNHVLSFEGVAYNPEYFSFLVILMRSSLDKVLCERNNQPWVGYKGAGEQRLIMRNSSHKATELFVPQALQLFSWKPGGQESPVVDVLDRRPIIYEVSPRCARLLMQGAPSSHEGNFTKPFLAGSSKGPSARGSLNVSDLWGKQRKQRFRPDFIPR